MKKMKKQLRKEKVIHLLIKGLTLEKIGLECGVTEKTIRRDLLEISKDYPEKKQESAVFLIESKRKLFKDSVELYNLAENHKEKSRALLLRSRIISELEKTYSRFGLIPTGEEDLSEENECAFTKGEWRKMMCDIAERSRKEEERKKKEKEIIA